MLALAIGSRQCPGLFVGFDFGIFKGDGLHHLSDGAVCQDHSGHEILVRQIKALDGEACHFLHGSRGQHDHPIVTVTAALGGLEVIGLGGLNTAQARAATLDIDHKSRNIRACYVAQALCFQRDSGAGGRGHNTHTGSSCAVNHVNGCNFTFRLQEDTADFRHFLCHVGGNFRLRGNGISEIVTATGANRRFGDGFIAFHKYSLCHSKPPYFSTVMMQSGHMVAQNAQPIHLS